VLIEFFLLNVAAEVLCENRLKIGILQGSGSVFAKFSHRRGHPPPIIFTQIDRPIMPYNFVTNSFHTKNFVADFLQAK